MFRKRPILGVRDRTRPDSNPLRLLPSGPDRVCGAFVRADLSGMDISEETDRRKPQQFFQRPNRAQMLSRLPYMCRFWQRCFAKGTDPFCGTLSPRRFSARVLSAEGKVISFGGAPARAGQAHPGPDLHIEKDRFAFALQADVEPILPFADFLGDKRWDAVTVLDCGQNRVGAVVFVFEINPRA